MPLRASWTTRLEDGWCARRGTEPATFAPVRQLDDNVVGFKPRPQAVIVSAGDAFSPSPPWFVNRMVQREIAKRWIDGREHDLGPGVPYATTANATVGASALPGHAGESVTGNFLGPAGTYSYAVPHAVAWDARGRRSGTYNGIATGFCGASRGDLQSTSTSASKAAVFGMAKIFRATVD